MYKGITPSGREVILKKKDYNLILDRFNSKTPVVDVCHLCLNYTPGYGSGTEDFACRNDKGVFCPLFRCFTILDEIIGSHPTGGKYFQNLANNDPTCQADVTLWFNWLKSFEEVINAK